MTQCAAHSTREEIQATARKQWMKDPEGQKQGVTELLGVLAKETRNVGKASSVMALLDKMIEKQSGNTDGVSKSPTLENLFGTCPEEFSGPGGE